MHLSGELDWSTARDLETLLSGLEDAGNRVILDLTDVVYIESGAIGLLITVQQDLNERGGAVAIVCRQDVRRTLERVGLSEFFQMFDDQNHAVAFLRSLG